MNGRGGSSALVDSIVSSDRQGGAGGILCNDPQGLCVAHKGAGTLLATPGEAGVFTNLVRLAAQLSGNNNENSASEGGQPPAAPLITLETADKAVLVKDYAGYAVAVCVPRR